MNKEELLNKRRENIKLARKSSNETNNIKGLIKYTMKNNKKQELKNELFFKLISSGLYPTIYKKYEKFLKETDDIEDDDILAEELYKYINDKELDILTLYDFKTPEELNNMRDDIFKNMIETQNK